MQTAVAEPASPAGTLDEQLATRLLYQRIIVLGTEVDDRIANRLCAQLLLLSAEDARSDISLYINSPGGSVSAGLAIYDTMQLIPNEVSTLAMGLAGSMGQFLLCAGTAGEDDPAWLLAAPVVLATTWYVPAREGAVADGPYVVVPVPV